MKNDLWFQKLHKEFGEEVVETKVDKSSVYNVLAEGMYFLDKSSHRISTFWTFHCLSEVIQIPHMIFETRSQFLDKFSTIL